MLAALGAGALPLWYLAAVLPLDRHFGYPLHGDEIFAWGLAVALMACAPLLALGAVRARDRARRRRAALAGDATAVPRSQLILSPPETRDTGYEPLVVSWGTDWFERFLEAPFALLGGLLMLLVGAVVALEIVREVATGDAHDLSQLYTRPPFPSVPPIPSMLGFMVIPLVLGWIMLRWSIQALFGQYSLTASDEGLLWRSARDRSRLIRWEDARLLEVSSFKRPAFNFRGTTYWRYRLYSPEAVISWDNDVHGREMRARYHQLFDAINARTHLRPRTFSRSLRAYKPWLMLIGRLLHQMRISPSIASGPILKLIAIGAFWLLYPAAVAIVIIMTPPTTSLVLNTLIMSSLVAFLLVVIYMCVAAWQYYGGRYQEPTSHMFAIRLWLIAACTLLCVDGIPALALWYPHAFDYGGNTPLVPAGFAHVVAYLLIPFGFVGVVVLVMASVAIIVLLRNRRLRHQAESPSST